MYSTPVKYQNLLDRELILSYNFETEETSILGLKSLDSSAETLDIALESLRQGDTITPIHYEAAIDGGAVEEVPGKAIQINDRTRLEEAVLPDGKYVERIAFVDLRCDEYFGPLVSFTMKDGNASEVELAPSSTYFCRIWD